MNRIIAILSLVLLFAVSACTENRNIPHLSKDFGNATIHNFSQHIVNPDPVTAGYGAPALNGTRAAGVIERYTSGSVIEPDTDQISK